VAGSTTSTNFPGTNGGAQPGYAGGGDTCDAFVSLLSADLKSLIQSTYLGGTDDDEAWSMAVSGGNVYVAGLTTSTNFPGTIGGAQPINHGVGFEVHDGFVSLLSADLKSLFQSTYLGGTDGVNDASSIAVSGGTVYVAGSTTSTNFPNTIGGAQPGYSSLWGVDGFVSLLSADLKAISAIDFSQDRNMDILWRHKPTGTIAVWFMDGITLTSAAVVAEFPYPDWVIVGTGDFSKDGKTDILWRHKPTGTIAVWFMDGITLTSAAVVAEFPYPDWVIVGTGDFSKDGKTDILWRHKPTGTIAVWFMDGITLTSAAVVAEFPYPDWEIVGTGDFNKDGKTDILWRHKPTGTIAVWFMDGITLIPWMRYAVVAEFPYPDWVIQGTGDFNNDGKTDILWRHTPTGTIAVWNMDGITITSAAVVSEFPYPDWEIMAP
jgi:hypothetical protein